MCVGTLCVFLFCFVTGTIDCQCSGVHSETKALDLQFDFTAGVAVKNW